MGKLGTGLSVLRFKFERTMPHPTLNPDVVLLPATDGYIAYDPVADRLHNLNPIASLIAELCDGGRSLKDIRELVEPFMPAESAVDIERWIKQATEVGLIVWSGTPAGHNHELSAEQLSILAHRLRQRGKVEVAFLCWKRVTELKPDDADAWYALGDTAYWLGRLDDARTAYVQYLNYHPEDAELQHFIIALGNGASPSRASNACIQQIYRRLSSGYEALMREHLDYQAPERILDAIRSVIGDRGSLAILDLGCGSGLAGAGLRQRASQMVGVDLSPEMIGLARERNIYDQLDIAEITDWLDRAEARFDLIVVCECLVYFGDLHGVVTSATRRLNPGGVLALTVEHSSRYPFYLTNSGRYAHHLDHIREVAAAAALSAAYLEEGYLRMEYGGPVTGLYAVLKKNGEATV
jgi:predicted TPR repeat methyltransferase